MPETNATIRRPVSAGSVLDRDPDLGEDLHADQFALARKHAIARFLRYQKGPWTPTLTEFDAVGNLGLLIVDGILVRQVTVGERTCAELLGPGDISQPWLKVGPEDSVGTDVSWEVAEPLRMAVLDQGFVTRIARWPEISAAIAQRIMLRVYWLSFHLAVCHMRRVDDRLLLVMWHFADRWGRVTPRGVEILLPLPHRLLALVVGAHRPTVTTALRNLADRGVIASRRRSQWLLCGQPPAEFRQVREYAAHHDRPVPVEIQWERTTEAIVAERRLDVDAPFSSETLTILPETRDPGTPTAPPEHVHPGTTTLDVAAAIAQDGAASTEDQP